MHTCLMARSKEHVNVLTAVWSISFQCTHTYTPTYTCTHAHRPSSRCWRRDKTAFHISLSVYRISQRKMALARRVTLSKNKFTKDRSEQPWVIFHEWFEGLGSWSVLNSNFSHILILHICTFFETERAKYNIPSVWNFNRSLSMRYK